MQVFDCNIQRFSNVAVRFQKLILQKPNFLRYVDIRCHVLETLWLSQFSIFGLRISRKMRSRAFGTFRHAGHPKEQNTTLKAGIVFLLQFELQLCDEEMRPLKRN